MTRTRTFASIEFEVADEPWAQVTARLLRPGLLVAVCVTPSFHDARDDPL